MSKKKLKKPLFLMEEFAAGEVSNTNQNTAPSVKTQPNTVGIDKTSGSLSGEEVRAEIVKDVDAILTNLEALSNNIQEKIDFFLKEGEGPLNENLEEFIQGVVGKASALKGMTMLKEYEKLKLAANANKLDFDKFQKTFKIDQAIRKIQDVKDSLEGPAEQKAIAKIQKLKETKTSLEANFDLLKEKAANQLAEVDEKLKKLEDKMGGKFKEMYDTQKTKANATVAEKGLELKAQMLKAKGKDDAAKEAAADLAKAKAKNAEMEKTIADINIEVSGGLDEEIAKVEEEIRREKEEDLVKLEANLKEKKAEVDKQKEAKAAALKKDKEADTSTIDNNLKGAEDAVKKIETEITKTKEGIDYLEGYLFDLRERKEKEGEKKNESTEVEEKVVEEKPELKIHESWSIADKMRFLLR